MSRIFIIEAKRTAIGKFLGSLYEADPAEVCVQLIKSGFEKEQLSDVESVIVGNVISAGAGQGIARKIAVLSGIPITTPAYSLNMVCGSGMQAVLNGVREIRCGARVVLCGGFEFMSNIPYATNSYIRLGKKFGDFSMIDLMTHDGLLDAFSGEHMGITAENVAKECKINRKEQDEYAYLSQQRAISAVDSGVFKDEIVPVTLHDYRGREYVFETDEFPNRQSTPEKLEILKPTFLKDGTGTITAGNTSGINDGASFMLLASEEYCQEKKILPLAEVIDGAVTGCEPRLMGLGPYYAIKALLAKTGTDFKDIANFEINEAFAAQVLGCYKLLAEEFSDSMENIIKRSNIYGSGLGLGHPLGATGARITTTLAHILKKSPEKCGIASLCIGGGMGAALMLKGVKEVA
ncbi:acetyl-CoA acetyltransferase [Lachnospiraceae bacterium]|uniref:thiolase family protein n=1 Tax=Candidatus Merdisoma sp. JLR.KK011 TaxID=3114299 RepID=UPI0014344EF1|nr:acetyl-CoA acetyltransferase [Lachnospiraceae bacterium]